MCLKPRQLSLTGLIMLVSGVAVLYALIHDETGLKVVMSLVGGLICLAGPPLLIAAHLLPAKLLNALSRPRQDEPGNQNG